MPPGSARPQRWTRAAPDAEPYEDPRESERGATGRGRLPLVLGAATGILVCALVLAVLLVVNARAASPEATGQALCADLQAQNYDAFYAVLAPSLQGVGTSEQFGASQRELDTLSGKVTRCAVMVQQEDGAQATLTLSLTRQQTGTARATVHIELLNGAWRVDAYDTAEVWTGAGRSSIQHGAVGAQRRDAAFGL